MEIDKTTLNDLSIFVAEEEFSVFNKLNFTRTTNGRETLHKNLSNPLRTINEVQGIQQTVKLFLDTHDKFPVRITNGTLMVVETFYVSNIDTIPANATSFSANSYKLLHGPDFSLVKYSLIHCFDFIKGMKELVDMYSGSAPTPLKKLLDNADAILKNDHLKLVYTNNKSADLDIASLLRLVHFIRYKFKRQMLELVAAFSQLDAWYSMAVAMMKYNLVFPELVESDKPFLEAEGLYHILLDEPVSYNVELNQDKNFLFLTGANMAGKSTFIKSVGTAVFLAHAGMGVPAMKMRLCLFDGLLSNINVIDNLVKGESYFYNEVQRIKATINKINDGRKWLILIDELFKGTNVQDAMKCSKAVIEGLLKIKCSVFILSTHLYEIGEDLRHHSNIRFNYFETTMIGDTLKFSYQLREGISDDRLGYLILKQEGVVDMLEKL